MIYTTTFDTPICSIILVGNEEGLSHLHLNTGEGTRQFVGDKEWREDRLFFADTIHQINEYMAGERQQFDIKLNPQGTDFQKKVWHELTTIGYGELASYKEIACAIGNPNSARAVGMATSKNPLALIIPCHRIVGAKGQLTGFAHGLAIKETLITFEHAQRQRCTERLQPSISILNFAGKQHKSHAGALATFIHSKLNPLE